MVAMPNSLLTPILVKPRGLELVATSRTMGLGSGISALSTGGRKWTNCLGARAIKMGIKFFSAEYLCLCYNSVMSMSESYTTLKIGGVPRDFDVESMDRTSDDPLLAALGDIAYYFNLDPDSDYQVTDGANGRVLSITLGHINGGNRNTPLLEHLETLRDLGVSFDVTDDGSYEFEPSVDWWRPGMTEVETASCDQEGVLMLYRQAVESVLTPFPAALAAIRETFPAPPEIANAPAYQPAMVVPGDGN
jgi:hypothetical protein